MQNLSKQPRIIVFFSTKISYLLVASIFLLLSSSCSQSPDITELDTTSPQQAQLVEILDANVF
jgi:hypothetical protein